MYDPVTANLIRHAPGLAGLDLERLPEELTAAYATLVSIRVTLRSEAPLPDRIAEQVVRLRALANTYETLVCLLPEIEQRRSAAFVAATAHNLLTLANSLLSSDNHRSPALARDSIAPSVSAALLFLVAGYPTDAEESVRHLPDEGTTTLTAHLLSAIKGLVSGTLVPVLEQTPLEPSATNPDDLATEILWRALLKGVRVLAARLLGHPEPGALPDPSELFALVQREAVLEIDQEFGPAYDTYPGCHHLATLLLQAGRELESHALVTVPCPPGVDDLGWRGFCQRYARSKPFVWQNHIDAIRGGFLTPGTSRVLSFPTGAGKSTLADLRIAATLLQGHTVLFLVPTHALVGQVGRALQLLFPGKRIATSLVLDAHYAEVDTQVMPDVAVMTPERALTLAGVAPQAFANLGLVVFDECHLLHPREDGNDRRSVDAMLCILNLIEQAPDADFLLMSAMIQNADELASWLADITQRPAHPHRLEWKPTRQARACVVFDQKDVAALQAFLGSEEKKAKRQAPKAKPSAPVKRGLKIPPYCLFSLRHTWTTSPNDYRLLKVIDDEVQLSANEWWKLTANRNQVAAVLAAQFSGHLIKTLVFTQNKTHAQSIADDIASILEPYAPAVALTAAEADLQTAAELEAGGAERVIGICRERSACHHGLLLPPERRLSEVLFSRRDGVSVLAATPTLAQGMNLPAEVVIIAGDDRFDAKAGAQERLEAHELLNAAGRAGRAGHVAKGVVLLVPGKVVVIDEAATTLGPHWFELQSMFSSGDQCLTIDDPLEALLDNIQLEPERVSSTGLYLAQRLPRDAETSDESACVLLSRSLAAYRARARGDSKAFDERVQSAISARRRLLGEVESSVEPWIEAAASATGASPTVIQEMAAALRCISGVEGFEAKHWVRTLFQLLRDQPHLLTMTVNSTRLPPFPDTYAKDPKPYLDLLRSLTWAWMTGKPLSDMELLAGSPKLKLGKCMNARKFAVHTIPELSYAAGLFAYIHRVQGIQGRMPLTLATVSACIREGHTTPEELAVRYEIDGPAARIQCRNVLRRIATVLEPREACEPFARTRKRVQAAMDATLR